MKGNLKKLFSGLAAAVVCSGALGNVSAPEKNVSALGDSVRLTIDLNAGDGRKASYSRVAENWIATGDAPSTTINGVSLKLSNGGSVGSEVRMVNNKKLQLQSGIYPYMTMDGAKINDGDKGGVLKLEISRLSAGHHSLKMWHSCVDNVKNSSLTVSVNGKTTAAGVQCPTGVKNEDDAGISYAEFDVKSGETVTVLIKGEGNGDVNNAWLNALELDGADPVRSISKISPSDKEKHFEIENGLSWTAGQDAKSHDVYIGTDYNSVANATKASAEYKGSQTGTKFDLDSSYSSINTYYWRVDEVDSSGNVVKGAVYSFNPARVAFPTAEGYGRYARGGRGGRIVEVTNLNDSGEGSLRQALEVEKGPRIVVFKVGGIIELKSVLCIPDDGGDVYVAGQTAPGDGITLINYDFGAMGASDVVIRGVRVRVGDMNGKSTGGMGLGSCNYSIVDHCSISWATDEGFSSRSAQNISFQWNIIAESLNESVHYDAGDRDKTEPHSFAASISGYTGSFHHNLLVDNTGRNVSLAGAMEQDAVTYGGQLDFRNNVVYNWRDRTTDGGVRRLQFVNNYYKAGEVSNTSLHVVSLDGNELGTNDMQKMYVSGNKMTDSKGNAILNSTDDAWAKGKAKSGGKNSTDADVRSDTPFFEPYVNTQSADDAYKSVIASAGANQPGWDYLDSRYIKEVTNGTYTYTGSKAGLKGIIDSQNDVGGYPNSSNFKGGAAPADSDHDGMPDAWETEHGLDPNDASDGAIVSLSADDYTNVEMYLNELAGDPVEYNGIVETISAFETIEAESFSSQEGIRVEDLASTGGQNIGFIESGDSIMFRNVDFEDGAKSFKVMASGNACKMELYLGVMSGTPAASVDFAGTSGFSDYQEAAFNIPKLSGVRNLYIRFTGGDGYLMNMDSFVFGRGSLPLSGRLIKELTVLDTEHSESWSIGSALSVGKPLFGDRDVTYAELPEALADAEYIITACDSKNSTGDLAQFTAGADMTVYVAMDSRVTAAPEWMSGFEKTSMTAVNNKDVTFIIYRKAVKSGEKVTLGTNGQSAGCVNYTVFAEPAPTAVIGDVNADGEFSVADLVMMEKWLLGSKDITDWTAGDLVEDGVIDAFDLAAMRKLIVK
ncbi:MAG: carbohydrate-binding protein [Alistipes sp.]|nr:carbohydrate-binding protein [Alistipes sp.]